MNQNRLFLFILSIFFGLTIPQLGMAQKLLDPAGSGGPISVVIATSGGVNTSVTIAYSVRQLKTTYDHNATITPPAAVSGFSNSSTPLLRIRRSTDNGQLDIGYDGSGNLDTVTAKNFVTNNGVNPTANGFVTVWYDQSGNSRDAYQTNTAQQFRIVNAGMMERSSSGQIGFGGVSGGMLEHQVAAGVPMNEFTSPSGINIYGIDSNRTLNVVSQPKVYTNGAASDGGGSYLIDRNGSTGNQDRPLTCLKAVNNNWTAQIRNLTGDISSSFEGSVAISTTRSDNVTLTRTGDVYAMYVNGVLAGSNTLSGENKMTPVRIGYGTNTGENVYYGEFTLFPSSLSSGDLSALNTSQGSYFVLGTGDATWTGTTSTAWATGTNWNSGVVPDLLTSVTIPSGTSNSPTITAGVTIKKLTIASGATLTNNSTLTLSDSLKVDGTLSGSGTVVFSGGIKQVITGSTSPITFTNLTINNTLDTVVCNNSINVSGTLTVNANCEFNPAASAIINNGGAAGIITGSGTVMVTRTAGTPDYQNQYKFSTNTLTNLTVNYGGAGAQNINLGVNYGNLAVSGSGIKTLSAAITSSNVTGNLTLLDATFDNGGFAIAGAGGKTLTMLGNSILNLSGTTSAFPTVYTISLGGSSTVNYSGSASQTITAQNYVNLTSSSTGARVLANSGTIGISSTFTPGTNAYTITSSTIDFNGTGAQTINAFNYNNLTISGARTGSPVITLASGTVNVASTLSVTATGVGSYAVTGNTVNYSGAAQTVASGITYNNLTLSGSGIKTTTSVTVNGTLSMEGTATVSAALTYGSSATLQYNKPSNFTSGSEFPSTFSGTGGVFVTNTGTITFSAAKAITFGLSIATGAKVNLNALNTHTADALYLNATGQNSGTWGGTGSGAANINATFFGAVTGRITIAGTTATWTGGTSVAWGTASNWSTNAIPGASTNVVIPSGPVNQPSITSTANCLDITINSGATLTSSSTLNVNGDFNNSGTTSFSGASTTTFAGTANQSVSSLASSGAITSTKTSGTVTISGTVTAASLTFTTSGATINVNGTLTLSGALTLNNAANANVTAAIGGSGTINCGSIEVGNGTAATTNSTTRTHTLTSTVSNLNISGNLNIRSYFVSSARFRNGVFTHTSGTLTVGGTIATFNANGTNSATYTLGNSSPVLVLTGATPFTLSGTGTSNITLNGTGAIVNYNGTSAQTALGGAGKTYTTLKANNTAGVTLNGAATITTLTIGDATSNSIFNDGGFVITPGTGPTLNLTSGTYNLGSASTGTSWPAWTTANLSSGTTVGFVSAVAQAVSSTPAYKNLTFSGAGTKTISAGTTLSVAGDWSITGGTATFTTTANATITGNISGSGAITIGSGTITLAGAWNNSGTFTSGTGTVNYNGSGAQTVAALNYTNLTVSGSRTGLPPLTLASGTIGVSGTFSFTATGFNGYTTTGNTFDYNGTGAQTIGLINYNNLTISGARTGSPAITLSSGTISLAGAFTVSATGCTFITTGNTINYNGSGAQSISAFSYNNLSLSGTRNSSPSITLASGTISVTGSFSNSSTGIGSYITTGNTFNYSGTGAQSVEAIDYNNLTISTARSGSPAITFNSGTTGIAGTLSITATGIGSYVVTGSTINYNAAAGSQNVLNTFTYNNLSLSNTSGTNTVAGAIAVTGTFTSTAGGTLNMGTNALTAGAVSHAGILATQNTSSLPIPSGLTWGGTINFNGASQTIPAGTYNAVGCQTSGTKSLGGNVAMGGTLTLSSAKISIGANTLTLNGDLSGSSTNNTMVGGTTSNLTINGSGALSSSIFMSQVSSAEKTLNQFTFNRSSGTLALGDSMYIKTSITPTAGTLTTNGFLIIGSDASGTGNVLSGSGTISGNVRVQRFIPAIAARRWRFMASPVSGATLNDWKNEIHITGTGNNFDATLSNFSSFYSYTESTTGVATNGWVAATDGSTTPLTNGQGFRVFVRGTRNAGRLNGSIATQDNVTMDVNGPLVNTDVSPTLTYTVSGGANEDGWNLIGNPYASAFDWGTFYTTGSQTGVSPDLSNVGRYSHVGPTIYIYDGTTNSYASYNANSAIAVGHLTGGIIPSGAAFFIQTRNTSPSITLKESNRVVTAPGALYKSGANEQFRIRLVMDSINSDETVIKYAENASDNEDGLDISKMYGSEVNIASITPDGHFLSANIKSFNGVSDTIPLSIGIKSSGQYQFDFSGVNHLLSDGSKSIGLLDKFTSRLMDLRAVNSYPFSADLNNPASFGNERFSIIVGHFTGIEDLHVNQESFSLKLYPSVTHDLVNITSNHQVHGNVSLRVIDIMGNTLQTTTDKSWNNNAVQVDLTGFTSGVYFIEVNSEAHTHPVVLRCIKE